MKTLDIELDTTLRAAEADTFDTTLRRKIVGQEPALIALTDIYQTFLAGLNAPGRPIGTLLFLGPTGTGKTRTFEALGETLFGDAKSVIKIDCAEFQHSHEIAKLLGSPPGYLGHRETSPIFTQNTLNQWHTEKTKLSLLMFDEIEKASDALWKLMLGIMDKASVTLGDNRRTDFSQTLIAMTSNLGAGEMNDVLGDHLGFSPSQTNIDGRLNSELASIATNAAKRKFSPEFMNRIDKTIVFHTLTETDIQKVLELELGQVQQRILQASGNHQFVFTVKDDAKAYLLKKGYEPKYGARELKRVLEVELVQKFSQLISTGQLKLGDFIEISMKDADKLRFVKKAEGALVPMLLEKVPEKPEPPKEPTKSSGISSLLAPRSPFY